MALLPDLNSESSEVHVIGASLAFFANFLPDLNLVLFNLRQRYDLLHVHQKMLIKPVGFQTNAANINVMIDEPQHRGGQFFREFCRCENDANILRELIVVGFVPTEKIQDDRARVLILFSNCLR